jgi:hypothetical protein
MSEIGLPGGSVAIVTGGRRSRSVRFPRVMPGFQRKLFCILISVFALEYATYLVRPAAVDGIIKVGTLALLAVAFPYYRPARRVLTTFLLFAGLLATALVGSISILDPVGVLQLAKLSTCALVVPLIVLRFRNGAPVPRGLLHTPIAWGLFFATQAVILFTLITLLNVIPPATSVEIGRLENMTETSFGVLGYGNAFTSFTDGSHTIRPQGWMLEPSNLSSFLLYPTLVSFGLFFSTKRKRYLIVALICLAGLAVALSLAGYFSFLAAILMMVVIRPAKRRHHRPRRWLLIGGPLVAGVLFVLIARRMWSYLETLHQRGVEEGMSQTTYLLGRGYYPQIGGLVRVTWKLRPMLNLILANPLGRGLGNTLGVSDITSPNALVFWVIAGGVPALIVLVALMWNLFKQYCYPLLVSPVPAFRCVAGAFVAVTVHGLSYGHWLNPFYLVCVSIMILCANHLEARSRDGNVASTHH